MKIKMLKDLHNEYFDLTAGKIYTDVYYDGEKYVLRDDDFYRVGLSKADENIVFKVVQEYVWKEKYKNILEKMGFITMNGFTYFKEYDSFDSEDSCFSIILIPCLSNGYENTCVLNFYTDSNEEEGSLTNKMTCEIYKDMTSLIMNDIIGVDFTIRDDCFDNE